MERDYVNSIHVLVPQVEEMFRNLLALIGVPTYKNVKEQPGVVDAKSMGEVLRDERLKTALHEGFRRYITVLYTDTWSQSTESSSSRSDGDRGLERRRFKQGDPQSSVFMQASNRGSDSEELRSLAVS